MCPGDAAGEYEVAVGHVRPAPSPMLQLDDEALSELIEIDFAKVDADGFADLVGELRCEPATLLYNSAP